MGGDDARGAGKHSRLLQQQRYLSDDLIIQEILTRLPAKSVLRFKSVSKQWYSTLSSSKFATVHLNKPPYNHPCAPVDNLVIKLGLEYYLFSYDDNHSSADFAKKLVKLDDDLRIGEDNLIFTGSCNGLICLSDRRHEYFILWNPVTRKVHKYALDGIPKRPQDLPYSGYTPFARGFGYAPSVDDYKYIQIMVIINDQAKALKSNFICIFSCKTNEWKRIDFDFNEHIFGAHSALVHLLNEKLYWRSGTAIVSFDLRVEEFNMFQSSSKYFYIGIIGQYLYKLTFANGLLDILTPPTTLESVTLPTSLGFITEVVGFTRDRKFFVSAVSDEVGKDGRSRLLWLVDTSTNTLEYSILLKLETTMIIARYSPSLISPSP